jgi:hypothetical protein
MAGRLPPSPLRLFLQTAGNIKPDKERSNERIDGISALVWRSRAASRQRWASFDL